MPRGLFRRETKKSVPPPKDIGHVVELRYGSESPDKIHIPRIVDHEPDPDESVWNEELPDPIRGKLSDGSAALYRDWTPEVFNGVTLIAAPGWHDSSESFAALAAILVKLGYRIIALDHRDLTPGQEPQPGTADYSVKGEAARVAEVAYMAKSGELGGEKPEFLAGLGHSMGGPIVEDAASTHPDLFDAVVGMASADHLESFFADPTAIANWLALPPVRRGMPHLAPVAKFLGRHAAKEVLKAVDRGMDPRKAPKGNGHIKAELGRIEHAGKYRKAAKAWVVSGSSLLGYMKKNKALRSLSVPRLAITFNEDRLLGHGPERAVERARSRDGAPIYWSKLPGGHGHNEIWANNVAIVIDKMIPVLLPESSIAKAERAKQQRINVALDRAGLDRAGFERLGAGSHAHAKTGQYHIGQTSMTVRPRTHLPEGAGPRRSSQ